MCRSPLFRAAGAVLFLLVLPLAAAAAPVSGELWPLHQPDGTPLEVRIWGDEFYRVVESLDGYTLLPDPATGEVCYARLSADGDELLSTGNRVDRGSGAALGLPTHLRLAPAAVRAISGAVRAEAAAQEQEVRLRLGLEGRKLEPPSTGNVQGLCLLIDFADAPATMPAAEVDAFCNQVGYTGYGCHGSVRDYYYDVSNGALTYTNYVPAGWFRASQLKSYYDDCGAPYGSRAREMIIEALNALEQSGFDFSQYDANGDGLIDGINCFYAGLTSCAWAQGLWPHSGWLTWSADGVSAARYQVTGLADVMRLYTFCHENGHMICYWPDLYDYDGDSRGVGLFCLMCSATSSINPQQPCAYLKMTAGWADVRQLTDYQADLPVPTTGNVMYRYEHPSLPNEFYLIENRQRSGRDLYIPDAGLAIWHVDTEGNNSNQQMTPSSHYLVTLVQADGRWDLEHNTNSGDMTDLWAAPDYPQCTPLTDPDTDWWDGSASELAVMDISAISADMTFTFNPGAAIHVPQDQPTIQAALDAAHPGSSVELDDGLYTGPGNRDLDFGGKAILLRSGSGEAAACVLDCEGLGRGFDFHSGEGAGAVVRDLTIRNGSAPGIEAGAGGGAVRCDGASPTFEGCLFQGSTAASEGGAVRCVDSYAMFQGCTFLGNTAVRGGAVFVDGGAPGLAGCTLHGNGADQGGGLYVAAGAVELDHTIISGGLAGAAAACDAGSITLDCCDVHGNAGGDGVGCLAGQLGSNGNFSADPLYCGADAGDLHLDENSPCAAFGHPDGPRACEGQQIGAWGVGCRTVQLVDATTGPLGDPGAGRSAIWGDYDGDGDLDLYVVNDGAANHLLRNEGASGFVDATTGPLADAGAGRAAVWGDYDGDGDLDLYVVNDGEANHLLRNEGAGGFVDSTPAALADAGPGRSASWRDYDNDGNLDLYVVQENSANLLLRSYGELTPGNWFFLSASAAVITDTGPGSAAAWADYDRDGDSDLYLVNRYESNLLVRNFLSLGFANASGIGALADNGPGTACAWGDYDNDGDLDLYVVNDGTADLLLRNMDSSFVLVVGQALGDTGHGRAAAWSDYDLDGDLDLYLARAGEPDLLLNNHGAGVFTSETLAAALTGGESRSVAWGDADGDGDPDLYVAGAGANYLLRNDNASGRHWFQLRLHGDPSNACGIGARVRLVGGGKAQVREVAAEGGPVGLTSGLAAFGLGSAATIDSLIVRWPSGNVQVRLQVAADIVLDLTEQDGLSDAPLPGAAPAAFALSPCYPNPFNPRTTIRYELPEASRVDLRIYDVAGRLVSVLAAAERQSAGAHATTWDGTDRAGRHVAAGLYFCRLAAGAFRATRRLLLVK